MDDTANDRTTTRDSSTDDVRAGAVSMGDITDLTRVHFPRNTLNGAGDRIDYYRFTLTEPRGWRPSTSLRYAQDERL